MEARIECTFKKCQPLVAAGFNENNRHGVADTVGLWKSCTTRFLLIKTHSSSPPENANCSFPVNVNVPFTVVVNLEVNTNSHTILTSDSILASTSSSLVMEVSEKYVTESQKPVNLKAVACFPVFIVFIHVLKYLSI